MIIIRFDPDSATAALNSQAFQGAGGIANAIPGLSAVQVVETFAVSQVKSGLADAGISADVEQTPDSKGDYYASRGLTAALGFVAGAIIGALLKG
jgi:hypothetical protein